MKYINILHSVQIHNINNVTIWHLAWNSLHTDTAFAGLHMEKNNIHVCHLTQKYVKQKQNEWQLTGVMVK
jgi:hypothetical protein